MGTVGCCGTLDIITIKVGISFLPYCDIYPSETPSQTAKNRAGLEFVHWELIRLLDFCRLLYSACPFFQQCWFRQYFSMHFSQRNKKKEKKR